MIAKMTSLAVFLSFLGGCAAQPSMVVGPWPDCAAWPSAKGRTTLTNRDILELAQEGKVAHGDCAARYDALRDVVGAKPASS